MRNWSLLEKLLAGVAAVVFVGVAVLGVVAWRSGGDDSAVPAGCEGGTLDIDLRSDDSPTDAMLRFVQSRPDEFPSDISYVVESVEGGTTLFVSEERGRYEIEVTDGLVRRFLSCPDG